MTSYSVYATPLRSLAGPQGALYFHTADNYGDDAIVCRKVVGLAIEAGSVKAAGTYAVVVTFGDQSNYIHTVEVEQGGLRVKA